MAAAVLFGAASCAKEDISSSIANGETVEVTFTANLPELGTRAYGEGLHANKLFYNVYEHGSETALTALCGTEISSTGKFYVTIPMIKGMKYDIVFWAQNADCGYYTLEGKKVKVIYNGKDANDDTRDAFFYYVNEFDPTNPAGKDDVKLYRPFAQLNAATNDVEAVAASGVSLVSSTVTVNTYTCLNIATGAVEGETSTVTFAHKSLPTETLKAGYTYLSMNYILVNDKMLTTAAFEFKGKRADDSEVVFTNTTYDNVPLQRNYRTNILGSLLTKSTEFEVEILPGFGGEEVYEVEKEHVATAQELTDAIAVVAAAGGEIVLEDNIELSSTLSIADLSRTASAEQKVIVIDGKGNTLTYTGSNRAIDITATNVNVTIKNLTIDFAASYCQRGINYNTAGTLTLDNVKVNEEGKNVTYALNLPGNSDNAIVSINNSSLTGNIALNVWGEDSVINAENSQFTSVDKTEAENYSAIALNNDGTTVANGTIVTINGGKITALDQNGEPSNAVRNATQTGEVVISNTTEVIGLTTSPVAVVKYDGYNEFYSCATLQAAINKAIETNASSVVLIKDVELTETATIAEGGIVVLDLNGKTLAHSDAVNKYAINNLGTLTIKGEGIVTARGIYNGYGNGGDNVASAKLIVENGTFNAKGTNGGAAVYNYGIVEVNGGKFESNGGYGLNNQAGGTLSVNNATVNGGIYNVGTLTIINSTIYQHLSGKHAIYNWTGSVTIDGGEFDSASGNELILADGQDASVVINGGTFNKTAKSWLFGAATGKNISFVINGGTHNGYVNKPEMTVDTIRPYGDPIVVTGGTFNFNPTKWLAEGYKSLESANGMYKVVAGNYYDSAIVDWDGVRYEGEWFESGYMENTLWLNNLVFSGDAAIKVENKTYGAIIIENCSGNFKDDAITINNTNNPVMILQNLNFTLAEGKKLIKSINPIYQVFMANITINGEKMTQQTIAQYLENVAWYQVVEEI